MKNGRNSRNSISEQHTPVIQRRINALAQSGRYHEISVGVQADSLYSQVAYSFNQGAYSAWLNTEDK